MAVVTRKGSHPHVEWIDLKNNRVLVECAVLKRDDFGNIYYIDTTALDGIDKGRLARILHSRHANSFPLWDLMSQSQLPNGMNALDYFHQIVKIITPDGVIMNPRAGQVGYGKLDLNDKSATTAAQMGGAPVESVPEGHSSARKPGVKGKKEGESD